MHKPAIVFMGTPEFAVASLDAIIKSGFNVKGVVTSPDKPSGRGLQMHSSQVKQFALKNNLPVLQPLKLKDPEFLRELHNLKAELQVVVAFRMLPEEVWNMPPLGTFNLHASLLPQYRGAAPINWAVINGETKTGVTTFFLNNEIDKGSIIHKKEIDIYEQDTAGDLHDRLMSAGADLVVKTIRDIACGNAITIEQHPKDTDLLLKPAPKIFKSDCRIHWNNRVEKIYNFIRGLSPYPAAWSEIITSNNEKLTVKIYICHPEMAQHELKPGSVVTDGKKYLRIAVSGGFINIANLQLQAKKPMDITDFLRGSSWIKDSKFQ